MKNFLFLLWFIASPLYAGNVLYTATSGGDDTGGNNCQTIGSPCDLSDGDFKYELGQATADNGDILYLCAGACDGSGSATLDHIVNFAGDYWGLWPDGTSWAGGFTLAVYPGETITYQPSSGLRVFQTWDFQYGIVDGCYGDADADCTAGLIFDGVNLTGATQAVFTVMSGNYQKFRGIEVKNGYWSGITTYDNAGWMSETEFIGIVSHDNGRCTSDCAPPHGIYLSAGSSDGDDIDTNTVIAYSQFYANHNLVGFYNSYGIMCYTGATYQVLQDITVHHNIVYDNDGGIELNNACRYAKIYNNVVYENDYRTGIRMNNCDNAEIYNNTIADHTSADLIGLNIDTGSDGTTVQNNILANNFTDYADAGTNTTCTYNLDTDSSLPTATGNIEGGTPSFTDAANDDYSLTSASDAINAGTDLSGSGVTDDYDGVSRPQPAGGDYDMGAYEFIFGGGINLTLLGVG